MVMITALEGRLALRDTFLSRMLSVVALEP